VTWADLAVLVLVAISAGLSFMRGLVREVLGLAAWAGAAYLSYVGIDYAIGPVRDLVGNEQMSLIIAHTVLFLGGLLVLTIGTSVVAQLFHSLGLGAVDRTLGILFGIARGALLVVAGYIAGGWFATPERWPEPVREARLLPLVADSAAALVQHIPERFRPSVPIPPPMAPTRAIDLLQAVPLGRQPPKP
jgi:membrane protein required for colicin V production